MWAEEAERGYMHQHTHDVRDRSIDMAPPAKEARKASLACLRKKGMGKASCSLGAGMPHRYRSMCFLRMRSTRRFPQG
eukprot:366570-Chlamydomonas_euryale.AAC.4